MEELLESIFLTGILVSFLCIGYIKFRDEYYVVEFIEKAITVIITLLALAAWIISAFILIWI